jgi:uncharacterized protein YndB with AHSA1/START domain
MRPEAKVQVRVSRHFDASPERVFDAWLDPARARRFLFATQEGTMLRAEIDARVGGGFTLVERRGDEEIAHFGQYLEIDRPRRLVFLFWVGARAEERDRVTIEIAPDGTGCALTLTHEMNVRWAEYKGRAEQGWGRMLEGLARAVV